MPNPTERNLEGEKGEGKKSRKDGTPDLVEGADGPAVIRDDKHGDAGRPTRTERTTPEK